MSDLAKALSRSFEKRLKSDYGDFSTVTIKEAEDVRQKVKVFIECCTKLLESLY